MSEATRKKLAGPLIATLSKGASERLILKQEEGPTGKEQKGSIKEGWLTKQGNYIKNWRPRWFQLKDGALFYYKEPSVEVKPTNYFVLVGPKVYEKVGRLGFDLIMANGERRSMQAQTEEERDSWCAALDVALERKTTFAAASSAKPNAPVTASSLAASGSSSSPAMTGMSAQPKEALAASSSAASSAAATDRRRLSPEDFVFTKVLGKGNYGKVMLATLKEESEAALRGSLPAGLDSTRQYAVKIVKKSGLMDEESLEHVLAENRVLQTLDHPFLVKLYYSFQTQDRLYFVMEYISGGELFFHIGREKRFSETRCRFYAGEILLALAYLHKHNIVYRDLKLENLLLDANGHVKITDFGLVKEDIGYNGTTSTFCGTPEYLAPEVLEEENYGRSVDWWAMGVVLYEMMIGKPPFGPTNNMEKLFQNILTQPLQYPPFLSDSARSLLEGLLCRDCTKRLGCGPTDGEEIKAHPFFAGIDFDKLTNKVYQPPFKPQVEGATDVSNFDKEFTQMPAILTPEISLEGLHKEFENFTFVGASAVAD